MPDDTENVNEIEETPEEAPVEETEVEVPTSALNRWARGGSTASIS